MADARDLAHAYLPIGEHGLVGDLHTVALGATTGTIDWCCRPTFGSPSVFGSILDADNGGFYAIRPVDDGWTSRQLYFPDTNILITRFFTDSGVGEVQDFMPIEAVKMDMHRHRLIRRVVVVRGQLRFLIEVQPRFDYGRAKHEVEMHPHGAVFRSPDLTMALEGVIPHTIGSHRRLERCDGGVRATFELAAGESQSFMLERVLFIAPTDPRWLSTLEAIGDKLVSDSLVYRYNVDASPDGLRGDEGTFSMCSFWYVEALTRAGRLDDARLAFEKMLTYANHLGLFSEEIGPTGEQLGNFPQAFTHLALISAAYNLDRALG